MFLKGQNIASTKTLQQFQEFSSLLPFLFYEKLTLT